MILQSITFRKICCCLVILPFFACNTSQNNDALDNSNEVNNGFAISTWPALYGGSEKDFIMWITIEEDMKATVQSVLNDGSLGDLTERTDYEYLRCERNEVGFTLVDPDTGEGLYSATADNDRAWSDDTILPYGAQITWSHSSGAVWDKYAEERGWKKELRIQLQIMLDNQH